MVQAQQNVGEVALGLQALLVQPIAFGLGSLTVCAGRRFSPPQFQRLLKHHRMAVIDVTGPVAQVAEAQQVDR